MDPDDTKAWFLRTIILVFLKHRLRNSLPIDFEDLGRLLNVPDTDGVPFWFRILWFDFDTRALIHSQWENMANSPPSQKTLHKWQTHLESLHTIYLQ